MSGDIHGMMGGMMTPVDPDYGDNVSIAGHAMAGKGDFDRRKKKRLKSFLLNSTIYKYLVHVP